MVYDLDNWLKFSLRNFTLKSCLFGVTNLAKNSDKSKDMYWCYEIAFNGRSEWKFGNDCARNVIIFGVNNSSLSHTGIRKHNFLVLGEGDSFGINGSFGAPEKRFGINFSESKTKVCLSLHYSQDNSSLFVNGKEIYRFKADNKDVNLPTQFCLGSISNKFDYVESEEVFLKWDIYDFWVDYEATDKSDTLNTHKNLMVKNIK